jgi:hypothetical protein
MLIPIRGEENEASNPLQTPFNRRLRAPQNQEGQPLLAGLLGTCTQLIPNN